MARFRRKARSFGRRFARGRRSRSNGSGLSAEKLAIGSGIYGAARPFVANVIPDVSALGGYSDNIILGVLGYLGAKKGSGMVKTAGMVVLANEAFIAGAKITQSSGQSNPSNTNAW